MHWIKEILQQYDIHDEFSLVPFGSGLIHHTWKLQHKEHCYILQQLNQKVFTEPWAIAENIDRVAKYLALHDPEYLFIAPLKNMEGNAMVYLHNHGYFRLLPFVENSVSHTVAASSQLAFEAAKQFGKFARLLSALPPEELNITLPHFHDLTLRYQQFEQACRDGNTLRIAESVQQINFLREHHDVVDQYNEIRSQKICLLCPTHHDTKISNVLFDQQGTGVCVIDLDTLMPGYFISDVGDMMRTYLTAFSEEEKDLSLIQIKEDYFRAIAEGYLSEMRGILTKEELGCFVYSGIFITYMQSLRFLTDHLMYDRYYGASYEGHNLVRAKNQIALLQQMLQKKDRLEQIVLETLNRPPLTVHGLEIKKFR